MRAGTVPLRRLFRIVNGGTPTSGAENWGGGVAWATPVDLAKVDGGTIVSTERTLTEDGLETGSRAVPPGSLVLSTRAPIGYVAKTKTSMAFNQGCRGLVPARPDVDVRHCQYQLLTGRAALQALGNGSTFQELSSDALADFRLVFRPVQEQRRIADFLDAETSRIDALIAAKRQMIGVVKESLAARRDAVLWNHSTSRPLHTCVDSRRQIMYGIVLPGPNVSGPDTVPIIKGGDVAQGFGRALNRTTCEIEVRYERSRVRAGDIVITIRGGIGDVEAVPASVDGANLTQDVARVAPASDIHGPWLLEVMKSPSFQSQVESVRTGATITGINIADLKTLRVPLTSVAEMKESAQSLAELSRSSELLSSTLTRQIELLRERRQALITAAVTGELEVA